jgi:P27 family predicted phage terminase small subunit
MERLTCPQWLDDIGKVEWKKLLPQLDLTKLDVNALATYCQAVAELEHATATLTKEGRYYTAKNGCLCQHPCVSTQQQAMEKILKFGKELGLTPAARKKMGVKEERENNLEDMLQ